MTRLDPSDFVEVTTPDPAAIALEGALRGDSVAAQALSVEAQMDTIQRYGTAHPGPIHDSSHAQALVDRTAAQRSLAEAEGFALPDGTPAHRDYVTPQPERPGSAEDRQRTRSRIAAMNDDPALGGIAAAVEFTDVELDVFAELGRDPVAEARAAHHGRQALDAQQALSVARREAAFQADRIAKQQAQRDAYARQAQAAIDAARARGADETWINYALSLGALPGHPATR
jgi:hypothetical protein